MSLAFSADAEAATIVFSNISQHHPMGAGSSLPLEREMANSFIAGATSALGEIDVALSLSTPSTAAGDPTINLYADGTGIPGALLATATVDGSLIQDDGATILTAHFVGGPTLVAGVKYWIAVRAAAGPSITMVDITSGGLVSEPYRNGGQTAWSASTGTMAAFEVRGPEAGNEGTVPEPGAIALAAGAGVAALATRRRTR